MLTTVVAAIGWLLVIVGWLVVNRNAARHAHRTQDLDFVRAIEARLALLCVAASDYYTGALSTFHVRAQEAHIKRELQAIVSAIGRLHERSPRHYGIRSVEPVLEGCVS